ncbi:hypothetical protein QEW_4484 [Clostridioides difficile CD160]|nr:hypothetical protein QEW_4484 [Clostridioides difficile CD160]
MKDKTKVYLGLIEKNNNLIGILGLFDSSGEFYKGYKKYFSKKENSDEISLSVYRWGISRLRLLHQNSKIKTSAYNIFINNKTIFNFIEKEDCKKELIKNFITLSLELSILPVHTEIFYKDDMNDYLNYIFELISEETNYLNVKSIL